MLSKTENSNSNKIYPKILHHIQIPRFGPVTPTQGWHRHRVSSWFNLSLSPLDLENMSNTFLASTTKTTLLTLTCLLLETLKPRLLIMQKHTTTSLHIVTAGHPGLHTLPLDYDCSHSHQLIPTFSNKHAVSNDVQTCCLVAMHGQQWLDLVP